LATKRQQEFVDLIASHQGILHKVCRIYARTEEEQEDLFQEMVLQLWRSYGSFRGQAKLSTWLYRIALNTAISAYRKQVRRPQNKVGLDSLPELSAAIPDPDFPEKRKFLYQAIQTLTDLEKAIVLLYLEDHSYDEIAQIVGITRNHVGVKLNRIKEKLRKKITPLFEEKREER
jgi:RNA polymerase sigma factor (sigma-70 family)